MKTILMRWYVTVLFIPMFALGFFLGQAREGEAPPEQSVGKTITRHPISGSRQYDNPEKTDSKNKSFHREKVALLKKMEGRWDKVSMEAEIERLRKSDGDRIDKDSLINYLLNQFALHDPLSALELTFNHYNSWIYPYEDFPPHLVRWIDHNPGEAWDFYIRNSESFLQKNQSNKETFLKKIIIGFTKENPAQAWEMLSEQRDNRLEKG